MAVPDTDDTPSSRPAAAPGARPSWETAPRPAAPRPAPAPRQDPFPRPSPAPASPPPSPYYAAPAAAPPQAPAPAAYAPDMDVKYDLAGNPIASSAPAPTVAAPFGYSAGNAAPGVWPPPSGAQPSGGPQFGAQAYRNNSGEQSHLPLELEKLRWHWGAFFFPILWTKKHGLTTVAAMLTGGLVMLRVLRYIAAAISPTVFLGICVLYGVAYFALQLFCGFNGHKIGWRNRHFPGGVEEYFKVQNAWMWWGFGINFFLVPMLWFGFFAAIVGTILATPQHHTYRPYGSYSSPNRYGSPNGYGSSNSYGSGSYGNSNSDGNSSSTGQ